MTTMQSADVVLALAALAHASRLKVYRLLVRRGPEGYTPGELVQRLGIPAPTLSFHLRELVRASLVESRREGRYLFYSASFQRMRTLIDFLTDKCCTLSEAQCDINCNPTTVSSSKRRPAA